jgi:hypothetical protein
MNKNSLFLLISLLGTITILRVFLYFFPFVNLTIRTVNIHHLYLGALVLVLLIPFLLTEMKSLFISVLVGIAAALVVDELVYLVATDGSDLAYFSTVSWIGMILLVSIVLGLIFFLSWRKR